MMGTLMHIQQLFYNISTHHNGPNAGKVNKSQLKQVLLDSEQFVSENADGMAEDYMGLLDTDNDGLVGFFDFLQPIMHIVPPEVITAFTQD